MTNESLKIGEDLKELIYVTEKAIDELEKFKPKERESESSYDDKIYNLCISQHNYRSGIYADLTRYYGNERLLDVIKKELKNQLAEFKMEFENL